MKQVNWHKRILTLIAIALVIPAATGCATAGAQGTAALLPITQSYTWYDGDRRHTIWLDPNMIIEFNPGSSSSTVRMAYTQAQQIPARIPGVVLWLIRADTSDVASRNLNNLYPDKAFSPVFREDANHGAPIRGLPGHVIVSLDPSWSLAEVHAWLQRSSLEVVEQLDFRDNTFLIQSEPGLPSLELARKLHESSDAVYATPNWWLEMYTR